MDIEVGGNVREESEWPASSKPVAAPDYKLIKGLVNDSYDNGLRVDEVGNESFSKPFAAPESKLNTGPSRVQELVITVQVLEWEVIG